MIKKIIFILLVFSSFSFNHKPVEIFLIGDSISIEYYPYLKKDVIQFAVLNRKQDDGKALENLDVPMGANGGDSQMVLKYLKSQLEESDFNPDYLLLNCGLHDVKRNPQTNEIQISDSLYSENLKEIFRMLKNRKIKPIWINTTAVVDSVHNSKSNAFKRYAVDIIKYNKIAQDICAANNIPSIDLHSFTEKLGKEQFRDHVHYNVETQKNQAEYIAQKLKGIIE